MHLAPGASAAGRCFTTSESLPPTDLHVINVPCNYHRGRQMADLTCFPFLHRTNEKNAFR